MGHMLTSSPVTDDGWLGLLLDCINDGWYAVSKAALLSGVSISSAGHLPVVLLLLGGAAVLWSLTRRFTTLDLYKIPSPWGIPLVGQLLQMALHISNGHEQFVKWHEAYGSIVRLRLFHRDVVIIADPQVAAQVLAKGANECPRRTPEYTAFDAAHGMRGYHAIMTEQNEERWKAIRRCIAPAYSQAAIKDVFPTIVKCYTQACERMASGAALQPPNSTTSCSNDNNNSNTASPQAAVAAAAAAATAGAVCIDEDIFASTIRILAEGFLKLPPDQLQRIDFHQASADVTSLVAITNTFVSQPWKKWLYLGIPGLCQESRLFHAQRRRLMAMTDIMAHHVESCRSTAITSGAEDISLSACLSRAREPSTGEHYSHQALQAELFLETVGQESIPWTLAWTLFLVSGRPKVEDAMLQELKGVGLPCNGDPAAAASVLSLDLLKQLPYCTAVLQEAMRMFPAGVAATPRMCQKVTQVGPYRLPPGTIVFPCLYSLFMYSGNWDAPQEFKPERWLQPKYATDPATGATRFVPFGIGPKACVAQQLAFVQCKVLLALLVSCFSWQLAPCMGGTKAVLSKCVAALELRVHGGMWLVPQQRS